MEREASETTVELTVPFHDLDPMQIVWHGNYLKYFEVARQQLFDSSGIDLYAVAAEQGFLFPIVKTSVKYIHPLKFRDRIAVSARVKDAHRRILLAFEIRTLDDNRLCARAVSEQVAVRMEDKSLLFEIPEHVRQALQGLGGQPGREGP